MRDLIVSMIQKNDTFLPQYSDILVSEDKCKGAEMNSYVWKRVMGVLVTGIVLMGCSPDSPVSAVVAEDDNVTMSASESYILIDVLKNDAYKLASGDTLKINFRKEPAHGTVTVVDIKDKPQVKYEPASGYVGTDAFRYCAFAVDPSGTKVGDCADVKISIETDEQNVGGDNEDLPEGIVKVGNLMWEDTDHVCDVKLTWEEAKTYCETLELGNYDDWRLSNADSNNISTAEFISIRQLPLKNNGEVYDPDNDDVSDVNSSTRTVIEPFKLITGQTDCASWTDGALKDDDGKVWGHIVGYYSYQKENFDGQSDADTVQVRCVRDAR